MKTLLGAMVVLLLLAGCGGDTPSVDPTESPARAQESPLVTPGDVKEASPDAVDPCQDHTAGPTIAIFETDNVFSPSCVRGKGSQGLQIKNGGKSTHNFSVEGTGLDVDTAPGEETNTEATGLKAGEYVFFCKFHRDQGMTGKLVIV
ncbi:MAG TPA: cupredoxin domain-containing protein [Actinomycetota bacterium]|nr:cupredoxin domain-containing protein [Actinomycetota bacterium]